MLIDNAVPVFRGGAPTAQCQPWTGAGAYVRHGLNVSNNVFTSPFGNAAVLAQSLQGLVLHGNVITRWGGKARYDLVGEGVAGADVEGSVCDSGMMCSTMGL